MNKISHFWRIAAGALILIVFSGCDGNDSESISDISKRRQCRANMNTLCTDQASYCDANDEWAPDIEQLNQFARRTRSLTCPQSGDEYILELSDCGYVISCPADHGSIETGRRSWTGGN